jgi:hypothetical protein
VAAFVTLSGGAHAITLEVSGQQETVFSWRKNKCDQEDIPDAGARAFRNSSGETVLIASHDETRLLVGPNLNDLKRDCRVAYKGANNPDPAAFDGQTWITSPYTLDGKNIYALVHNEYHGTDWPGKCPSGSYVGCWYNSITFAVSRDGGNSFERFHEDSAIVFAPSDQYTGQSGKRVGPSTPTNIVQQNGWFYVMFMNDTPTGGPFICAARTQDPTNPQSWRVWGGTAFDVQMRNPYEHRESDNKSCSPVKGLIPGTVVSLTRHERSGLFIVVQISAARAGRRAGAYYSTSPDLLNWSTPAVLWNAPTYEATCDINAVYGYFSLLDPQSKSRNFDTIAGDTASLYAVRHNVKSCHMGWDRDLIRVPVTIRP